MIIFRDFYERGCRIVKILTLNMHSYFEPRTYWAFYHVAKDIAENQYDVVCLQEVNQLKYTNIWRDSIRVDNAAYHVKLILEKEFHISYDIYWERVKMLDGLIEEGVAMLTPHKIVKKDSKMVSSITDIESWRCRKNIYACIEKDGILYNVFSVHFAWEDDGYEKFQEQFQSFLIWIEDKSDNLIVAGDFNTDPRNKDYQLLEETPWIDIGKVSGTGDLETAYDENKEGIHIDYIFTNIKGNYASKLKFTGSEEPMVSDHHGVVGEILK